ncbi:MAG: serine/threonine protein kinase [Gemmataceae bacterium]|nr:serine/threonine protein kinase [Gemmataceae bacterium]
MPLGSVASFVDGLRNKRLLRPMQLDELTRIVQPRFSDTTDLAKELVRRGWLTVYQVNQLFQENGQELVLGPYRLIDFLGKGGVSQVFKAWHTQRNQVVAVKVIYADLVSNTEAFGRFQRELRVVTRLAHPNVVQAIDDNPVGNAHFYAMEFVEGSDMGKLVQYGGPLPVDQACDAVRQAALGLQHAHELGLVHRDIKPNNLVRIADTSVVTILDFGLARLRFAPGQTATGDMLTAEGAMIGTADYVSPEQARDARQVDIRADIYSLGCTFYYLLSGQPPFPGGSFVQKAFKHQTAQPTPIAGLRPEVAAILTKMMAKQPEARYQTPSELAHAIGPFCPPAAGTKKP